MSTIIGLAGSLRRDSFNAALLRAAAEVAPEGMTVDIQSIAGIPLYDGDEEQHGGVPDAVEALKDRIAAADGLLLVTPEYNHGVPGVFKNAFDWLTRPPKDIERVFGGKPTALMGATPGRGGTRASQLAWLPSLRTVGTSLFPGQLHVAGAGKAFDGGHLVDPKVRELLTDFMQGFHRFIG